VAEAGKGAAAAAMAAVGVQMLTLRADGDFGTAEVSRLPFYPLRERRDADMLCRQMEFPNERGVMERYVCLTSCSSWYVSAPLSSLLSAHLQPGTLPQQLSL
jgi:hypothetical protein